jgi:ribosomal protein S18 acetylase RimI-like enzyme
MNRNTHKFGLFSLYPVTDFLIFAGFSCCGPDDKDNDLDDFIHNDAKSHLLSRMAVTYGFFVEGITEPLGFATLQNDSIKVQTPGYLYKSSPAVKIGRLGIANKFQRIGSGSALLSMLKGFMLTNNRTGCRYITLDAYNNPCVLNFYSKNGFKPLQEISAKRLQVLMYFDLESHVPHTE